MVKNATPAELKKGGVILVDKPATWTSFDAVNQIKVTLKAKIGHCGTLDPLATGLLICCTGDMTKSISGYQGLPKEYTGIIRLGAVTETYDLESEPMDHKPFEHITELQILETTKQFTGDIMQTPPIHSAIKKEGKRSYDLARAGIEVVLNARPVTIGEFEITKIDMPEVHFRVLCSTGTYIRSLANDFGAALGCGGYLQLLRRTKIGNFKVEDGHSPLEWKEIWKEMKNEERNKPQTEETL
ncbi:tRNA pseudouridine(55) synthase TruB [Flavipsychrobacter stenotrophus]|uniref:tRNA pseudouridine synthase B n=1 Tax=Flavipsychrobacter stenotrophus TaxID=2077091 RepID=A0A2S7SV19_9BACT|nr:tRNA pseudouridine(55) synthase TruB [Flavipsychrobacter stenotrophus]PQJ10376.1 tRNA pseudouridine(55) synthase TruB [Flavipsychrobacter stenotrophus]